MQKSPQYGFTLVELMITLSVFAIIAGIGIPSVIELIREIRTRTTAENFVSTLYLAKSEAIKRNGARIVAPSGWSAAFQIRDTNNTTIKLIPATDGVTISNLSGVSTIEIDRWGRIGANPNEANFSFQPSTGASTNNTRVVCTSIAGQIRTLKASACP